MSRLLLWLIAAFVPAAIGAAFPAPDYYARLAKPTWAPPPWLFGPAWTVLYALMGVAASSDGARWPARCSCPTSRG